MESYQCVTESPVEVAFRSPMADSLARAVIRSTVDDSLTYSLTPLPFLIEMETPRRSFANSGGNGSTTPSTTRFPGLGGAPEAMGLAPAARGTERTDDELHFARWKETVRAQDEEQALLHQTVVSSKKQQLDVQHERLSKQRAFIRHEKRKILLQNALLESEKERFEASLSSDWFCLATFPTVHDRRITLDVGGQLFEISTPVLMKDPNSMLAALVMDDSPLSTLECGCFRVDRNWWLFRYVLHFLRDGMLPQDPKLLRELYLESEFWKIDSLRKAIEMKNMELLQIKQQNDAKTAGAAAAALLSGSTGKGSTAQARYHLDSGLMAKMKSSSMLPEHKANRDAHEWWLEAPSWWGAATASDKKEPKLASLAATAMKRAQIDELENSKKGGGDDAWWKTASYKGKDFSQTLSAAASESKKKTEDDGSGTPRSPLVMSSTWPSAH